MNIEDLKKLVAQQGEKIAFQHKGKIISGQEAIDEIEKVHTRVEEMRDLEHECFGPKFAAVASMKTGMGIKTKMLQDLININDLLHRDYFGNTECVDIILDALKQSYKILNMRNKAIKELE